MGFSEAGKFGESDLGSARGVIGILATGRHVTANCERLCGPVRQIGATQVFVDGSGWRGKRVEGLLDISQVGKVLPEQGLTFGP